MSARIVSAAIGVLLMIVSHSPVAVSVAGVTLHVPVAVIAASAVALACAAGAVALVVFLHHIQSCPHLRTVTGRT